MYDDNLSFLEIADYNADSFWLEGEDSSYDDFSFDTDKEMDLISLEQASSTMKNLMKDIDVCTDNFKILSKKAETASFAIQNFIEEYENYFGLGVFNA